jgi:hypothetical protein
LALSSSVKSSACLTIRFLRAFLLINAKCFLD